MFRRSALAVLVLFVSNARAQQTPQPTWPDTGFGTQESTTAGSAIPEPAAGTSGSTLARPVSYALDYRATGRCPGRDEFLVSIAERVRSARAVTTPEEANFVVTLTLSPPRSALTIQKRTGERETRVIDVDSCLEAARAAALIVAVTLDPNATVDSTRAAPGAATGASPGRDSSPEPSRRRYQKPEPRSPRPRTTASPPASPSHPARRSTLELGAGESGDLRSGLTPKLVLGGSVLGLVGLGRAPQQSGLVWAPSAMLNVGLTANSTAFEPGVGTASFHWMGGALSLCPARIGLAPRLGILPCVALDAGRLHGAGNAAVRGVRSTATNVAVFAPGARLWARWWLADCMDLVVAVGAGWPTRRYRYWLPADTAEPRKLHELGSPVYSAGLGLLAVRR
ncbi:MAG: hypothetical protein JW940_16765 [Polyangiaceae bacterium]|nr:hypothetical protein [Polyangiaceae bacterium]